MWDTRHPQPAKKSRSFDSAPFGRFAQDDHSVLRRSRGDSELAFQPYYISSITGMIRGLRLVFFWM